jgi:hypothetical protein
MIIVRMVIAPLCKTSDVAFKEVAYRPKRNTTATEMSAKTGQIAVFVGAMNGIRLARHARCLNVGVASAGTLESIRWPPAAGEITISCRQRPRGHR